MHTRSNSPADGRVYNKPVEDEEVDIKVKFVVREWRSVRGKI